MTADQPLKNEGQLLTTRAAAEYLSIGVRTLHRLTSPRGPIPVVRMGGAVRFRLDDLIQFVNSQVS